MVLYWLGQCGDRAARSWAGAARRGVRITGVSSPDLAALREALEGIDRELLDLLAERMERSRGWRAPSSTRRGRSAIRRARSRLLVRLRHAGGRARSRSARGRAPLPRHPRHVGGAPAGVSCAALDDAPLRVAYQGVEGSNSHLAAQRRYAGRAGGVLLTGYETFRGAAEAVHAGEADLALLPIENSTAGSINETYDLLAEGGLTSPARSSPRSSTACSALPGRRAREIRPRCSRIRRRCAQCEALLPRPCRAIRAARRVRHRRRGAQGRRERRPALAAIASAAAARLYGLEILRARHPDRGANSTRFVEVALQALPVADRRDGARPRSCSPSPPTARRARRGPRRARAARPQPDQARVAADSGRAAGVPLLPRRRRPRLERHLSRGAGRDRPGDVRAPRAGQLPGGRPGC